MESWYSHGTNYSTENAALKMYSKWNVILSIWTFHLKINMESANFPLHRLAVSPFSLKNTVYRSEWI